MTRAEKRKYHYIYKTTCSVTNKFYIGMHSTDSLEDGYAGSGKHLWYSIRKHGKENHSTEILEFLPSREDLKLREAQIVNEELLGETLCMNLKLGGEGGGTFSKEAQSIGYKLGIEKRKELFEDIEWREHFRKTHSNGQKKRFEKYGCHEGFSGNTLGMLGKKHSEETKKKMASFHSGENNSQFGTCWIFNDSGSKKIPKEELDIWLCEGWTKGRRINGPVA